MKEALRTRRGLKSKERKQRQKMALRREPIREEVGFLYAVAGRFSLLTKTNNPKPEAGHQLILTGLSEHIINTRE